MEGTAGDEEEEVEDEVSCVVGKFPVAVTTLDRECCCVVDVTKEES